MMELQSTSESSCRASESGRTSVITKPSPLSTQPARRTPSIFSPTLATTSPTSRAVQSILPGTTIYEQAIRSALFDPPPHQSNLSLPSLLSPTRLSLSSDSDEGVIDPFVPEMRTKKKKIINRLFTQCKYIFLRNNKKSSRAAGERCGKKTKAGEDVCCQHFSLLHKKKKNVTTEKGEEKEASTPMEEEIRKNNKTEEPVPQESGINTEKVCPRIYKTRINRLRRGQKYYFLRRTNTTSRVVLLTNNGILFKIKIPININIPTNKKQYFIRRSNLTSLETE